MIARPAASRASLPGPFRGAVPDLGHQVGQRHDHERQGRVVVVLERGPIDAGPRDPLGREPDGDEGQGQAASLERHEADEREGRDAEPPDDEAAGVVERGARAQREALLVEPDRLQVHRPGPPRRRCGMGGGQAVVIAVHLGGQVQQGLAVVARPASPRRSGGLRSWPTGGTRGRTRRPGPRRGRWRHRRPAGRAASPGAASRRAAGAGGSR